MREGGRSFADSGHGIVERSLSETKDAIRKKLGLSTSAHIELMQVRGDQFIDLEDGMVPVYAVSARMLISFG